MSQEELDAREEARLSRALAGKVPSQSQTKSNGRVQSWAPVVTKPVATLPVNYSGTATGGGVDTASPYANNVNVPISDEKLRQEQARLKKWGLDSATNGATNGSSVDHSHSSNESTPLVSPSTHSQHVDSTPIVSNIDGTTNEDKIRQEQARLKRWGFNIAAPTPTPTSSIYPNGTTSNTSSNSSSIVSPPAASSVPASPFANGQANHVASQYGLDVQVVLPYLTRIISAGKSVKLILHKKSSNHDVAIAIMLDLVKESAEFGLQLPNDLPISFDISQASARLAVAVNELVNAGAHQADQIKIQHLYEDIQAQVGLLYLAVTAN
ncbi:hypothetical protein SAMD00019534_123420 [Acytostelium subglobosum LB1]|uniref:hypothetical protein n=1 Tax=Acytostelium subglobosum LB1 TaxID=1410327 RepID=UPI000644E6C4|nr:hypothetical protein SAMD00019534_123420 [Acytostelium subglobosum LB1]GAM29166.1 hypothetical protein SAMD00019534_123420 [Acytostelium subglobosum LB1]|eukprot:XP_012747857.1 hypothetical protein SAMD00019534_123420 [Acytostelium subglobosum LB1]